MTKNHPSVPLSVPQNINWSDYIIAMIVASVATIFHAFYFNHGVHNLMDLGVLAVDSARILDGQIYGLDFQAPYGPVRYYLIAGIFHLFGKSLFSLNGLFLVIMALNNALIYLSARTLMARRFALFAALLGVLAHGSIHKGFFIFSSLFTLFFLLRYLTHPAGKGAFRFGLAAGIALLLRWDVGVIGLLAVFLAMMIGLFIGVFQFRRSVLPGLGKIAAGVLVPCLPVGLALYLYSDPLQVLRHMTFRISGVDRVLTDFDSWPALFLATETRARLFAVITAVLFLSILLCFIIAVMRWRRGSRNRHTLAIMALVFMAVPLLNQVQIQIRFNRLLQSAPMLFIAFAYLLQAGTEQFKGSGASWIRRFGRIVPGTAGAGFLALLLFYLYTYTGLASQDSFAALRYEERFVDHPRVQCFMRKGIAKDLEEAIAFLEDKSRKDKLIFADPSCTLLYFLSDRPNPTPYSDWLYYYFQREGEKKMIETLDRLEVAICVLWPGRPVAISDFETACPDLARYVNQRFTTVQRGRRFVFMESR